MPPKLWLRPLLGSVLLSAVVSLPTFAQTGPPLWQPVPTPANRGPVAASPAPWFRLDTTQLAARLAQVPPATAAPTAAGPALELPHPDGTLHRYTLSRVAVMAPALAARYPRIRTFAGHSLDDPTTTVRLSWTPAGLDAQLLTPDGPVVISQAEPGGATVLYQTRTEEPASFDCQALLPPGVSAERPAGGVPPAPPAPFGSQIRVLRLAVAATGEYVQQLGGGTVAGTQAKIAALVNSLNGVYEREFALRLELVAGNDQLIFTDAATDPYPDTSPVALMNANAAVLNTRLGFANYDLGHVLGHTGNGYSGVAYVGVVCSAFTGQSGKGGGSSTASSDGLMATVTRHEIGHQLGSNHTFNGDQGNCSGGNRGASLAYEPGAGNTIMSYDSRCAPDNVGAGIVFFHAGSLSAIMPKLTCGSLVANGGNQPPSVSVPTGTYAIPQGTPFRLAGTGSDPNGDALTYSWEELDLGNPSGLAGAATDPSGPPLFRSFAPVASAERTFPQLSAIVGNTNSPGEILPLVARSLNFRLTARDNRGGVAGANLSLTVANAGPFRVTAPATALTARPNSLYTVTWDVLGTDQAPVSCANVRILFSNDGGQSFATTLLASTPNNGAAEVRLPNLLTTQGRVKVEALGNVFFAVSPATLTLVGVPVPLPVTLTAFRAEARRTVAHLSWSTATELRNAGFAVEVSPDGTDFRRVAWVPGRGQAASYTYNDAQLTTYGTALVYYRLRQLDDDGTASLSAVQPVAVPAAPATLELWPNPARGQVAVAGIAAGQLVQVLDLSGRVLLSAPVPAAGPLQLTLPPTLRPGLYLVRSGSQSRRLVVE